jgi:uncharacterized membrane protein
VREKCELFSFQSIINVKKMITESSNVFKLSLKVSPGKAEFQSVVRFVNGSLIELVGKIIRVSVYGRQSECMTEAAFLGYCFCKKELNL